MNNTLWVEKYRPTKIENCILPDEIKTMFQSIVDSGEIPNLLLTGSPGIGKTTVAKALCNQLDCDWLMINGSDEGRMIDSLRTTVVNYASTVSLSGGKKVIIIDEADYMNKDSVQPALRGVIEEFSKNCRFIFTCNFKNRIIEPLHSRCSVIEFKINGGRQKLAGQLLDRCAVILKEQNIEYDSRVVAELIMKHFPDNRRVLNELQRYSVSGQIDSGILVNLSEVNMKELALHLKEKEFTKVRKWVVDNIDNDPSKIFRKIYDSLYSYLDPGTIPSAVIIIGEYQYKSAFVMDQEINLLACLTEMMTQCRFK